jgi:small GTP-binding protein
MEIPRFKIVTIGDSGVGKTALVNRMSEDVFHATHVPTIGSQFVNIPSTIEGNRMLFEVWDTAGQEVYRSLVGFYARGAHGAFLVTDVTTKSSFHSLSNWINFVHSEAPEVMILIFANKIDLADSRAVGTEEIAEFASQSRCEFLEGSAKTGFNVAEAFTKMGELMLRRPEPKSAEQVRQVDTVREVVSEKECC